MSSGDADASAPRSVPATRGSTTRRVLRAFVGVAAATVLVRLLGLVKSLAVSAGFGVGPEVDAFVIAQLLPTFAHGVVTNALVSALVPTLAEVRRERGTGAARAAQREVAGWCAGALLVATLLLWLLWFPYLGLIGAHLTPEVHALAESLFPWVLSGLFFHGVATFWAALLQSHKRFFSAAMAPGAIPLGVALAAWLLADRHGVHALVYGHLAGVGVELVLLATATARRGEPLLPAWPRRSPFVTTFLAQYLPVLVGSLLMRSTLVVDQTMASWLPEGGISSLHYANVLVQAFLGVTVVALGSALLPYMSDVAAEGNLQVLREQVSRGVRRLLVCGGVVSGLLFLAAPWIVRLLLRRGAFEEEDVGAVALAVGCYGLQIPFFSLGTVYSRVLSALRRNQILPRIALFNLLANVTFNLALMPLLGVAGIALSTALVYLCSSILLSRAVARELRTEPSAQPPAP